MGLDEKNDIASGLCREVQHHVYFGALEEALEEAWGLSARTQEHKPPDRAEPDPLKPTTTPEINLDPSPQQQGAALTTAICTFRQRSTSLHLQEAAGVRWNPDDVERSSKKVKFESAFEPRPARVGSISAFTQLRPTPSALEAIQDEAVRRAASNVVPTILAQLGIHHVTPVEHAEIQRRAKAMLGNLINAAEMIKQGHDDKAG
jgi:hypothetical protein